MEVTRSEYKPKKTVHRTYSVERPTPIITDHVTSRPPIMRQTLSETGSSIIISTGCIGRTQCQSAPQTRERKKPKPVRQSSLGGVVSKHLSDFNQLFTPKKAQKIADPQRFPHQFESCPDLLDGDKAPKLKRNVPESYSVKYSRPTSISPTSKSPYLKVPDIFTTSLTRSVSSGDTSIPEFRSEMTQTKSTPELQINFLKKGTLKKSISDTPQASRSPSPSDYMEIGGSTLFPANSSPDSNISQIVNGIYISNIEAASNERLLCKLHIDSLVDVTNALQEKGPQKRRVSCPCSCALSTRHFRAKLCVAVNDSQDEDIEQYFSEINSFIEGVRKCQKTVLIYSTNGQSRAATIVIQHLMTVNNMPFRQAYNIVKGQWSKININPGFRRTLEKMDRKMFPPTTPSIYVHKTAKRRGGNSQISKDAWMDC